MGGNRVALGDCGGLGGSRSREVGEWNLSILFVTLSETKRYVNNPGVERFRGRMGGEKERKGVSDDQKLSTNGGFWTSPALRLSTLSLSFILSSNPDYRCLNGTLFFYICQTAKLPRLTHLQANLPNLRRLFVEARTEAEENEYSRKAVGHWIKSSRFNDTNKCSSTISSSSFLLLPSSA